MNIAPMCSTGPLFDKYTIDKQYNIKKLQHDGTEMAITDPIEKHKILDSNFLKGSIGITRDTNHRGTLHSLFYAGHIIHSFFHGHNKIDVNLCHGIVILKHAKPKKGEETHPFVYAHAILDGIHTTKWDDLKDDIVTEVVYYRPLSRSLRKAIVSAAYQTAYISKKEFRKKLSPSLKPPFSILNLIRSLFHNVKSQTGNVMGSFPSEKSMKSTSYQIADLLLGCQFLNENQQAKDFYCIPYALGVLQGGLVLDDLKTIPATLKENFIKNSEGKLLPRNALADKIFHCFRYKNSKDPIACQLWNTYWGNKLLRLHSDYLMAGYLGKKLDELSQNAENITASYHIVKFKFPEEKSWLERNIRKYKHTLDLPPLVKKIIDVTVKVLMVIFSLGLLLPLVFHMENLRHKIDLEDAAEKFHARMAEQLIKDPSLRPNLARIELAGDTCAFNHVFEFTINQGVLWQRRRDPINNLWEPLFFDGELTGAKPVALSTDGANLVVVDDRGAIHYRKVISEGRGYKDIHRSPSLKRHLKEHPEIQIHKKDTHSYLVVDKIDKPYWYTSWYNFPCLKHIVNAITGPQLFSKGIISHLGKYSHGYADANGKFHLNSVGTTTLDELVHKGACVSKYDPWVPIWTWVVIPFPRSNHTCFIAVKIDSSASTLMALGYEWNIKTGIARLMILTKLCDIDTMGGNPTKHYAHQAEKNTHPDVRVLPDRVENEGWVDYPLPHDIQEVYRQITIAQTGPGNEAYELRVAAKTMDGREGYYRKPDLQADTPWDFVPYKAINKSVVMDLTQKFDSHEISGMPFTPIYKGQTNDMDISLMNFDDQTHHSKLYITLKGKQYELFLHKRLGWMTFFGCKHDTYTLVIPEDQADEGIVELFGGSRTMPVEISLSQTPHQKNVRLQSHYFDVDLQAAFQN